MECVGKIFATKSAKCSKYSQVRNYIGGTPPNYYEHVSMLLLHLLLRKNPNTYLPYYEHESKCEKYKGCVYVCSCTDSCYVGRMKSELTRKIEKSKNQIC